MVTKGHVIGTGLGLGAGIGAGILLSPIVSKVVIPEDIKYIMSKMRVEFDATPGFEDTAPSKTIDGLSFDRGDIKLFSYVDKQKSGVKPGEKSYQGERIVFFGIEDLKEGYYDDWKDLMITIRKWVESDGTVKYLIQVMCPQRDVGTRVYFKGTKIYDNATDGRGKFDIWLVSG